jgi:hypothetical protein
MKLLLNCQHVSTRFPYRVYRDLPGTYLHYNADHFVDLQRIFDISYCAEAFVDVGESLFVTDDPGV